MTKKCQLNWKSWSPVKSGRGSRTTDRFSQQPRPPELDLVAFAFELGAQLDRAPSAEQRGQAAALKKRDRAGTRQRSLPSRTAGSIVTASPDPQGGRGSLSQLPPTAMAFISVM